MRAAVALSIASLIIFSSQSSYAQSIIERLYILNCGEGVAGDISRWSPGVNIGKPMDFVDNCYLIKHPEGGYCGIPELRMRSQRCQMVNGQKTRELPIGSGRRPSSVSWNNWGLEPRTSSSSQFRIATQTISATSHYSPKQCSSCRRPSTIG